MWRWAWNTPASTGRRKTSSMPSRPTTATWSAGPWWPAWCRRRTPFPRPVRVRGARTWKIILNVWKSWRRSPAAIPALRRVMPSRPAVRSASWSSPSRCPRIRWSSWPMSWPAASKASWNIPARSRSTSCVRRRSWSTRNKNLMFAGAASHCEAAPFAIMSSSTQKNRPDPRWRTYYEAFSAVISAAGPAAEPDRLLYHHWRHDRHLTGSRRSRRSST